MKRIWMLLAWGMAIGLAVWWGEAAALTGKPGAYRLQQAAPGPGPSQASLAEISRQLNLYTGRRAGKRSVRSASILQGLDPQRRPLAVDWRRGGQGGPSPAGVVWDETGNTPIAVRLEPVRRAGKSAGGETADDPLAFVEAHPALFGLQHPARELRLRSTVTDDSGRRHITWQQHYRNLPVWGQELVAHLDADGSLYALNGRYVPTPQTLDSVEPVIARNTAVQRALEHLSRRVVIESLSPQWRQLLGYEGPAAQLCIWVDPLSQQAHLSWHLEIRPDARTRWVYFIDAHTGQILLYYDNTHSNGPTTAQALDLNGVERTLHVFEQEDLFFMIDGSRPGFALDRPGTSNFPMGSLVTLDAGGRDLSAGDVSLITSSGNSWEDPVAVSAHASIGVVFEYYLGTHNRLGIDGAAGTGISIVHVTEDGASLANAFWNGRFIAYGDGGGAFRPLAGALDVAAHEMTHGVIERTVNLEYRFQSGALNESFADVFGAMVDRDDWQLGEDVVDAPAFPSGALRDMADPHNGGRRGDRFWQPAHMDEFVELDIAQDNGGVHINSGIPNHACFLIAQAIGREKTERIYYRVLEARYLNARAQFVDLRLAAQRAATDLFGESSPEVDAVRQAFDAVGIRGEETTPAPPDIAPVEGEEWLAVVNDERGDHSLFLVRPQGGGPEDVVRLTSTQVSTETGNPVSVAADGSAILFRNRG